MIKSLLWVVLFAIALIPLPGAAKIFRNAYVQFELVDLWDCKMENTEWTCSSRRRDDAREAIIILTAKEVGPQDSFSIYQNHLKTPRKVQLANGKTITSQIKHVRQRRIHNQEWVDSLHLGSEIPGYYTRYLATIKDKLAILVTLSAHQRFYTKYSNDYFKAVESLRVTASKDLFRTNQLPSVRAGGDGTAVGGAGATGIGGPEEEAPPPEDESSGQSDMLFYIGIILMIAAIGYYYLKSKPS